MKAITLHKDGHHLKPAMFALIITSVSAVVLFGLPTFVSLIMSWYAGAVENVGVHIHGQVEQVPMLESRYLRVEDIGATNLNPVPEFGLQTNEAFVGMALTAEYYGGAYLLLSDYHLTPGDTYTIIGKRFIPHEEITVYIGDERISLIANSSGEFVSGPYTAGWDEGVFSVQIMARGNESGVVTYASLSVGTYYPDVAPSKYYVVPGGAVSFTGQNFAPYEDVEIFMAGALYETVSANGAGHFTTDSITVSFGKSNAEFLFKGVSSDTTVSRVVHVASHDPWLVLSEYYVSSGTQLSVNGNGFGAGEEITVMIDGSLFGRTAADASGHFQVEGTLQVKGIGKKEVKAIGGETLRYSVEHVTVH